MSTVPRMPRIHLAAALLLPLCLLVAPRAARAHARLDHADPKVGSTVPAPSQVRVWFDCELGPGSSIAVRAPDGSTVGDGHGRVIPSDPELLETDVPRLAPGIYRVIWTAVAKDGHRVSGNYTFTVR